MLKVCVNIAQSTLSWHGNPACPDLANAPKPQQLVRVNVRSISEVFQRFRDKNYLPGAGADEMWLEIDFGDRQFEGAVFAYVHRLLGKRYAGIASAKILKHC